MGTNNQLDNFAVKRSVFTRDDTRSYQNMNILILKQT